MIIYLDVVFITNFFFDFILLFAVEKLDTKKVSLLRIMTSALVGSLSIFFMFYPLNNIILFIIKFLISIIMILITFKYDNFYLFKKRIINLYIASIFLGGCLYLINNQIATSKTGIIFISNYSINLILMIVLTPFIISYYIKRQKYEKISKHYHLVNFTYNDQKYSLTGFLDTGNNLYDPYKKRPVILVYLGNKVIINNPIIIPYQTVENHGLLKCINIKEFYIDNKKYNDVLVGISKYPFSIKNVEVILHKDYL